MPRRIRLTRSEPVFAANASRNDGWRIAIEAHDAELMPLEIFVSTKNVLNARTQVAASEFTSVASPLMLTTIPVDEPGELDFPPFFRTARIDVIVPSSELAIALWEAVVAEVSVLIDAMNRMDRLDQIESVWCGDGSESSA